MRKTIESVCIVDACGGDRDGNLCKPGKIQF